MRRTRHLQHTISETYHASVCHILLQRVEAPAQTVTNAAVKHLVVTHSPTHASQG
jgi:hypothetical protein